MSVEADYKRAMRMVAEVDADPAKCSAETRCFASLVSAVDKYHRFHMANVNDYVSRLIGAERGLCRCCGRAHAIQHEDDCPVPHLIHMTSGAQEADPECSICRRHHRPEVVHACE